MGGLACFVGVCLKRCFTRFMIAWIGYVLGFLGFVVEYTFTLRLLFVLWMVLNA